MSTIGGARGVAEALAGKLREAELPAVVHEQIGQSSAFWWICPGPDWPQYKSSQWLIRLDEDNTLWCGLDWEKGLAPDARGYIAAAPFFMDEPWDWTHLVKGVAQGILTQAIGGVKPLLVRVRFTNGLVPGFDPYSATFKHEMQWELGEDTMRLALPVYETGGAGRVARVSSLSDLWRELENLPEWRWLWVSCFLGWKLPAPDRPSHGQALLENQLWERLTALLPWYASE